MTGITQSAALHLSTVEARYSESCLQSGRRPTKLPCRPSTGHTNKGREARVTDGRKARAQGVHEAELG
jgi:hypothetical protein